MLSSSGGKKGKRTENLFGPQVELALGLQVWRSEASSRSEELRPVPGLEI
jgi:hypothetical protein